MSSSIEITPELLAGFLDEAPEYLAMLDDGLMDFESKAGSGVLSLDAPEDQEQMNTMFRAAHSLKGLAAAFGFEKIKELTHRMETLFDQVRMRKRDLTSDSFETLFQVFDRLKALVEELSDESADTIDIDDILAALDRILDSQGAPSPTPPPPIDGAAGRPEAPASAVEPAGVAEAYEMFDDPELTGLFIETTGESLEELNQGLLGLEENPTDGELLNKVFRCAHNIKGASGAASLTGMNRLTHEMETVFDRLRNGKLTLTDELMNAVFQAVDQLRAVIDDIRQGTIKDISQDGLANRFSQWIDGDLSAAGPDDAVVAPILPPADSAATAGPDLDEGQLSVFVRFPKDSSEASIQAYLIHNKLGDIGTVLSSSPDIDALCGDTPVETITFVVESEGNPTEIETVLRAYSVEEVTVSRGATPEANVSNAPVVDSAVASPVSETPATSAAAAAPASTDSGAAVPDAAPVPKQPAQPARTAKQTAPAKKKDTKTEKSTKRTGETLRVDQERLDELMNLGGELVINRARFTQVHGKFRDVFDGKNFGYVVDEIDDGLAQIKNSIESLQGANGNGRVIEGLASRMLRLQQSMSPLRSFVEQVHELRPSMFDFDEALHALARVSESIQKGIMSTRMVPVGPLFSRFRRVIRDIAKSNGKQINLVLRGENTELDKRMIDELGDPLTHMVRNSVDHGIEMPDERKAAGKDPAGTLTLEACHRGNSICIEVTDDGAGINLERVRERIIERELATPAQVESMSDRELTQYVFKPGFSTAKTITDVSGRGMGMDIVVNKIEKLSGTIDIDTVPGKGTKVIIKLPLTIAILTSLVARIGKGIYAIPLEAVAEIIKVQRSDIHYIQRREVVRVRDRVIPIARFEDVFCTSLPDLQTASRDAEEFTLVIVGFEDEKIGLVVDELLGQEDVVIKSIAENYRNVKGVAGASIRGDGTVSLIMDIGAIMGMTAKNASATTVPSAAPVGAEE